MSVSGDAKNHKNQVGRRLGQKMAHRSAFITQRIGSQENRSVSIRSWRQCALRLLVFVMLVVVTLVNVVNMGVVLMVIALVDVVDVTWLVSVVFMLVALVDVVLVSVVFVSVAFVYVVRHILTSKFTYHKFVERYGIRNTINIFYGK